MNGTADRRVLTPRFATVVLDVDSTLAGIEGIDWLADLRDATAAAFVRRLTDEAMSGRLALEDAYARRLDRIAPTREEMRALAVAYQATVAPGAHAAIAQLRRFGVRVIAVTAGLRDAVIPLCHAVALGDDEVFAVDVLWDAQGAYAGFDRASPLVSQHGKAEILRGLALPRPILAVGDGSTDRAMKTAGAADAFAAYTEFANRPSVVAGADHVLTSFDELLALVLPPVA